MRVLVTGGTSLIGAATVDRLLARGDDVVTLQRSARGPGDSVAGSITDRSVVDRAIEGCDAVVHLAAKVGAIGDLAEYRSINVDGTRTVLDAATAAGVARFVHVSSPSVAHAGEPLIGAGAGPADPARTEGPYSTTKAEAELLALGRSSDDLPVVAIRPHLVWGPGDTQLVGRIIERARQGRLAFVGSGLALIDTTYVDNAADALVAAVDRVPVLGGHAFVVSNGEPRTVHELVTRILAAAGVDASARHVPTPVALAGGAVVERFWNRMGRNDDPPMTRFLAEQLSTAHWFDQTETRAALDWTPAVSLSEGFARLATSHATGSGTFA